VRAAALAAALAGAAILPGQPLGVGGLVVSLLVALAVWRGGRPGRQALAYGLPALALAAMCVFRDATWVVTIDLAAAWFLAAIAVSGPTLAALAAPILRLRHAPALAPAIPTRAPSAVRGALLGGLLSVPFGALFWTADAAFAQMARSLPLPALGSVPGRALAFVLVLAAALGLALASRRPLVGPKVQALRLLGTLEWAVPLVLLNLLFLSFVVVQFAVFFGGHGHVLETTGLTYAEYARQGFWQLLAASALTTAIVGVAVAFTSTTSRSEILLQRGLLGLLCLLTLVVLASALRRLEVYEDAFGLTRLRLGAEAIGLWLGGLFVLLIGAGLVRRVRQRFVPAILIGSAVGVLAFTLANPDGLIAKRNVQRWQDTGRLDVGYLQTLSADATPEIAALPLALEESALAKLRTRLASDDPWSSFNVSRRQARGIMSG
jgi:Domain of unknown function (DUF4173)